MKRILLAATALSILAMPGLGAAQSSNAGQAGAAPAPERASTNLKSLGLTQDAWNEQLRARGASRKRPGYVRYLYNKEDVFPIRTREGMITTIKLPEGVRVAQAFSGDDAGFQVGVPTPTTVAIKALYPGVDTSLAVFTEDDQVFNFYLRSEGYNSKTISDFLVDVALPGKGVQEAAVDEGYALSESGRPSSKRLDPATNAADVRDAYASSKPVGQGADDYSDNYDFDPRSVVEDLTIYVPRKQTGGILPYKVFRDDRFTYIDYGPNASQITEWPTVALVVQGVESPVGFRTAGPGGRMIVVEALGDLVLRNGQRILCIRKKGSVSPKDKTLVEYNAAYPDEVTIPTDLPQGHGLMRSRESKTVVPATPATVGREGDTKVVPLPQPKFTSAMPVTPRADTTLRATADKRAKSPVLVSDKSRTTLAPSPVTGTPGVTGAEVDKAAAESAKAPVPVAVRAAEVSASASALPASAPALTPVRKAEAFAGYAIDLGTGDEADLAERWKAQKAKHAVALNGKRVEYIGAENGQKSMRVVPISTVAEGAGLCAELSADGTACSVIANR